MLVYRHQESGQRQQAMAKILLVEDDAKLAQQVKIWLEYEHHVVEVASAGDEALTRLRHYQFDLVVLDWLLPGMEGIEVCRRIRDRRMQIPVIMLTAKGSVSEKASGLNVGADDYITKPVAPKELSARIRALLRRAPAQDAQPIEVGDLSLHAPSLSVSKAGTQIALQPKELRLLELFMRHPNQLLSTELIIEKLWPGDGQASANSVKAYVNKLRSKFENCGKSVSIKAVYGQGYIFQPGSDS